MKFLVTGATGFIGTYVIDELVRQNHEVVATSTNIYKAKQLNWFGKVEYISYKLGDLLKEQDLFQHFGEPDALVNLAWQGLPNYNSLSHIDDNLFVQFSFLKNLIQNGLKNVTITGTCFEYGLQSGSLSEELIPYPSNSYAIAKDCLRRLIEGINNKFHFSFKWMRLFYLYGEGQNPKSLIPLLKRAIKNDEKEFNMSGGEQLRDYLPVEKVAENIIMAAKQSDISGIINCCSGKPISIKQLAENFKRDLNSDIKLNLGYYPYLDYEPMAFWGDRTKLDKILNVL
jgi:nucleoside-diphosphate-sugar epimerase